MNHCLCFDGESLVLFKFGDNRNVDDRLNCAQSSRLFVKPIDRRCCRLFSVTFKDSTNKCEYEIVVQSLEFESQSIRLINVNSKTIFHFDIDGQMSLTVDTIFHFGLFAGRDADSRHNFWSTGSQTCHIQLVCASAKRVFDMNTQENNVTMIAAHFNLLHFCVRFAFL